MDGDPALPLVSLALIGQTGQQGFAVLANSGIDSPADWAGKTAGYKGDAVTPDYLAVLDENHVDPVGAGGEVGYDPAVLTGQRRHLPGVSLANEPDILGPRRVPDEGVHRGGLRRADAGTDVRRDGGLHPQNPDIVPASSAPTLKGISTPTPTATRRPTS